MFRGIGINAIYLPFRVPRGELVEALAGIRNDAGQGYSVTIPHKEAAAALVAATSARETGAANTLVSRSDGFHACNTDYEAALEAFRNRPVEDGAVELKELAAMVLGPAAWLAPLPTPCTRGKAAFIVAARPTRR